MEMQEGKAAAAAVQHSPNERSWSDRGQVNGEGRKKENVQFSSAHGRVSAHERAVTVKRERGTDGMTISL